MTLVTVDIELAYLFLW